MKKSFSKLFLAPLTVLVLASFAMAPVAEAARSVAVAVAAAAAVVALVPAVAAVPSTRAGQ